MEAAAQPRNQTGQSQSRPNAQIVDLQVNKSYGHWLEATHWSPVYISHQMNQAGLAIYHKANQAGSPIYHKVN